MSPSPLRPAALLLAAVALATPAGAQRPAGAVAPRGLAPRVTATVSLGGGRFDGGAPLKARAGYSADALVAVRRPRGLLLAGSAGVQGIWATTDLCIRTPTGGCLADAPTTAIVAALAGWESRGALVRAFAGPAFVTTGSARAAGVQGRVDLATPALWRLAPTLSLRGTLAPSLGGEARRITAVGVGLRLR